ncbi:MAG: peptidoglycan D,D-transpeptidase FtsI family protein, partial [Planctomycetota bacterium]
MSRRSRPPRLPRTVPVGQLRRNLEAVQRFRLSFVFGAILVIFLGLLGRLGKLQLVDAATWRAASEQRHQRSFTFRGLRGRIEDIHGRTLVTSRRIASVAVDPQEVVDPVDFARNLAILLDDDSQAARVLRILRTAPPGSRHRLVSRGIEDERLLASLFMLTTFSATCRAGLRGLKVRVGEKRTYTNGDYARHVLGRAPVSSGGAMGGGGAGSGLERGFNEALQGRTIRVPVRRDGGTRARYRTALVVDPLLAKGRDLRLTLDIVVQHYLERELSRLVKTWKPRLVVGLVLDPRTGHVLAMANRNDPAQNANDLDYVVQGRFAPGSIFKPLVVAEALGKRVVGPDERLDLPRQFTFFWKRSQRTIHDCDDTADFDGRGDVVRMIVKSSNVGVAQLLWRLMEMPNGDDGTSGADVGRVLGFLDRLGFDRSTGIELEGDEPYRLDRSSGRPNPLYPTVGFAFGQGFVVSPLKLLCAFAALARDDARIVRPTLLPGRGGGRADLPPVCRSRADLEIVREGLARCVTEGTARRAFEGCAFQVCGKTGTAEIQGTPYQSAGFAAFAPRENPRLAVLVMAQVDREARDPETGAKAHGGAVAAPA